MYIGNNFPNDPSGVATLSAINRGFAYDENKYNSMPKIIEVVDCTSKTLTLDDVQTVAYPSSIQVGDTLFLARGSARAPAGYTTPTSFTSLPYIGGATVGSTCQVDYRMIDGTEGPTFTLDSSSLSDEVVNSIVSLMIVVRYADTSTISTFNTAFVYLTGGLYILVNQLTPQPYNGTSLHFYVESPFVYENLYDQVFMDANKIINHGVFVSKASGDKASDQGSSLRLFSRECKRSEGLERLDIPDEVGNISIKQSVIALFIGGAV